MVLRRLPGPVPGIMALAAVVLIVIGSRFVQIAGILLLGLALSLAAIRRSPRPTEPRDEGERR